MKWLGYYLKNNQITLKAAQIQEQTALKHSKWPKNKRKHHQLQRRRATKRPVVADKQRVDTL